MRKNIDAEAYVLFKGCDIEYRVHVNWIDTDLNQIEIQRGCRAGVWDLANVSIVEMEP